MIKTQKTDTRFYRSGVPRVVIPSRGPRSLPDTGCEEDRVYPGHLDGPPGFRGTKVPTTPRTPAGYNNPGVQTTVISPTSTFCASLHPHNDTEYPLHESLHSNSLLRKAKDSTTTTLPSFSLRSLGSVNPTQERVPRDTLSPSLGVVVSSKTTKVKQ